MRKSLLLLPIVLLGLYFSLTSYSSGAGGSGVSGSGATGGSGCGGGCHGSGTTSTTAVTISLDSAGFAVTHYVAGQTYNIIITGTQTSSSFSLPFYGFQLAVVGASGAGSSSASNAGTLASSGLPASCINRAVGSIRVVEHTARLSPASGSGGAGTVYTKTIGWTAPSTGAGAAVIYGVINAINNDGTDDSRDKWNGTNVSVSEENAPVTGTLTVCTGATTTLSCATSGGSWSSGATSTATVTSSGVVTGVAAGTVPISYTTSLGVSIVTVTVIATPTAGTIGGPLAVCEGAAVTLTSSGTSGGVWTSGSTGIATVNPASGLVTGVTAGVASITYTVTNACGTASTNRNITVNPLPHPGHMTGGTSVCMGSTLALSDTPSGGTWNSTVTSVATISTSGVVSAVSVGSTLISYTVTNSCGTTADTQTVSVLPLPSAGAIVGSTTVCSGATITLTDGGASAAGTWSSSSTSVATINSTGVVTGVSGGTATISYSVASASCGTAISTYNITVNSTPSVGAIVGSTSLCTGSSYSFTDTSAGGTWSTSFSAIASVSTTGSVTAVTAGIATISYIITSATCGNDTATLGVTVSASPSAGTILGAGSVCVGASIHLTDGTTGGTWSSGSTGVATVNTTGDVTGVTTGTAVISYSVTSSCGTAITTQNVTVITSPSPGTITGSSTVCEGATISLSDTATGGSWTSSSATNATVSSSGIVTGVAAGSATISYTVANICGIASASHTVTVNPAPAAGTISGPTSLCSGTSITLSATISGGAWTSSSTSIASVNGTTGDVFGVGTGVVTISYTVSNSCGAARATYTDTVNTLPASGSISGPGTVCEGATITLSPSISGGVWGTTTPGICTVDASGNVTGIAGGAGVIKYTITNICGSTNAIHNVTVSALPVPGTLSGPTGTCVGSTIALSTTGTGGTWSSGTTAVASVDASGNVTGISVGSSVISYTVTNGCGSVSATQTVNVGAVATSGTITGATTICEAATTTYTESVSGGVWSTDAASVASIDASGTVYGVGAGTANITYTVTTGCNSASTSQAITVNPLPTTGTLSGATTVCEGSSITLTASLTGGVWSSSTTSVATVNTTGVVTGVSGGTTTISYSFTNACGTAAATHPVTVMPLPDAGTLSGPSSICTGSSVAMGFTVMFGTWATSAASVASVDAAGNVYGVSVGSAIISYTITNACGTATSTFNIAVTLTASAGTISGPTTVCQGSTIALSDATTGGTWSSSASGVASVDASGNVTGVTGGTAIISYTVSTVCGTAFATQSITVIPLPSAGAITGSSTVCTGATTTLTDAAAGGGWTTSTASIASVNATGVVSGVANGSAIITYTVSNACGSVFTTFAITVITTPTTPSAITGSSTVCAGATTTLSSASTGGAWTTANAAIASVDASGNVTGVAGGTTNITYTIANACGSSFTTTSITVNTSPTLAAITGPTSVCVGSSISLSDATAGGSWSSSSSSIASIDASGNVTGVAGGTVNITYSLATACGTAARLYAITVNTIPSAGTIAGPASVCPGATITLTDGVSGGSWSSSASSLATISAAGVVTGIATGTTVISYAVSGVCGTGYATYTLTINSLPIVGPIIGASTLCEGATTTLTDTTSGGVWSSSAAGVATVNAAGVVTGLTGATVNIIYAVTNVCGTASAAHFMTINPLPTTGVILGASAICIGTSTTLTASVTGGTWSVSNANASIVFTSTNAVVHGLVAGLDTVYHTLTNGCGSRSASFVISIDGHLSATGITGPSSLCETDSVQLTVTVPGGSWSSTNAHATVSATGFVNPVTPGRDTIVYTVTNACGTATARLPINILASGNCNVGVVTAAKEAQDVTVYPNPSNGTFTVVIPATGNEATITIIDVLGKIVETRLVANANGSTSVFNLTGVAAGSYLIRINSGAAAFKETVVVY